MIPPLLIGLSAGETVSAALALGATLATSTATPVVAAHIGTQGWSHPSPARVDAEYAAFLRAKALAALDRARKAAPVTPPIRFEVRENSSPEVGLLALRTDEAAWGIVLGPGSTAADGHIAESAVASAILASATAAASSVPIFLAPRGYRVPTAGRVTRLSCGVSGSPRSAATAHAAGRLAARLGVPLRLVTVAAGDRQMMPSPVGYDSEAMVSRQFRAQTEAAHARIRSEWPQDIGTLPPESAFGEGPDWPEALTAVGWHDGEILALGRCRAGAIGRFFFGSNLGAILRAAALPCAILPEGEVVARGLPSLKTTS